LLNTRQLSYLDRQVSPGSTYSYTIVSVGADSRSEPSVAATIAVEDESYWLAQ